MHMEDSGVKINKTFGETRATMLGVHMYNRDDKAVFLHSQGESAFTSYYIKYLYLHLSTCYWINQDTF